MRVHLRAMIETKFRSQTAFARASQIELSRLNRIVRGWIDPTPMERQRCAEILGVDSTWLFQSFTVPQLQVSDALP